MNSKTAKLLRAFATKTGSHEKDIKNLWLNTPADKRGKLRASIEKELGKNKEYEVVTEEDGEQYLVSK
jgi:hypothetical protein